MILKPDEANIDLKAHKIDANTSGGLSEALSLFKRQAESQTAVQMPRKSEHCKLPRRRQKRCKVQTY